MDRRSIPLAVAVILIVGISRISDSPWVLIATGASIVAIALTAAIPMWRKQKATVAVTALSALAVVGISVGAWLL